MSDKSKKFLGRAWSYWPVVAGLVGIVAMGVAFYYAEHTIVDRWLAVIAAALPALAVTLVALRRHGGWTPFLVKVAALWLLLTSVIMCGALSLNYHCADTGTVHREQVVVESRHSETRYHTRRVRRNVVRKGEPYNVYFVTVRFNSGVSKQLSVTLSRYNKMRLGDTCTFDMARGLFGLPVILTGI